MDDFRAYSLKLPGELHKDLKLLSCKLDKPMSYIMRRAVMKFLENEKVKNDAGA